MSCKTSMTHHMGCECHEQRRNEELLGLRAELVACYRAMNRILLDAIPCPDSEPKQYLITDYALNNIRALGKKGTT